VGPGYVACSANPTFNDFVYEVQMTIIKGDYGGIIFRTATLNFYCFSIYQAGHWDASIYQYGNRYRLTSGNDTSIHTGLGQQNSIAVVANGNTVTFYMNGHQLDSVNDSTYSQGQVGVLAEDVGNPTEVDFRDAKVWTL